MSSFPPNNNFAALCPRCGKQLMPYETQCTRCGLSIPANLLNGRAPGLNNQASAWQAPQNQFGQSVADDASRAGQQGWGQSASPNVPQQSFNYPGATDSAQIGRGAFPPPFPPTMNQPQNNFQAPPQSDSFASSGFQAGGFQNGGFQTGTPQSGGFPNNNSFQNDAFGNRNYQNPGVGMDAGQDFQVTTPKRRNSKKLLLFAALIVLVLVGGVYGASSALSHLGGNGGGSSSGVTLAPPTSAPIFKDDFVKNTNGWDTTSNPGSFSAKIANGSMILEDDNHLLLPALLPSEKTKNLHNFRLSADAALSRGDPKNGYGMIFRCTLDQNGDLANYYGFEIYGDGTYIIFKHSMDAKGNATRTQIGGDLDNVNGLIQKSNNVNHLTIIAQGSTFQFFVNNQLLTTVQDSSYQGGLISLFVSNVQNINGGAQATFSHLAVYNVK
jgi:hypothetical protein